MPPRRLNPIDALRRVNLRAYANAVLNACEALLRVPAPHSMPVNVDLILTKACNLRCTFCISYGSLKGERWMSFELCERIARRLLPTAHGLFICSGGEPFLYPRLREVLGLARRYRTVTTVTSNGMLIDRAAARWLVADQSLHELCLSFDGATKPTLERIRRGASFDTILGNIARLAELKRRAGALYPRLWLRYVALASNVEELPEIIPIAARYGLYKVEVKHLDVSGGLDRSESLLDRPELAHAAFAEARRRAAAHGVRLRLPPRPGRPHRCREPWRFVQIDTDGSLRFCYSGWRQRLGFFDDGFRRIWTGEHYQRLRRTLDSPRPYYPRCRCCPARLGTGAADPSAGPGDPQSFLIPGLERWQVPFNRREEENRASIKEMGGAGRSALKSEGVPR